MAENKGRQPTRVGRDAAPAGGRKTQFYPGAPEPPSEGRTADDTRKIVGVLVSYSWKSGGQLFEVREGPNHIGAGEIKGENNLADIYCPQDSTLSSDHALILAQKGQIFIRDLASVNGTTVNGRLLHPESTEPLPSPAEIAVGDTVFTFVRFDPSSGAAIAAPLQPERDTEPAPRPGKMSKIE